MKLIGTILVFAALLLTGCSSTKNYLKVTDIEPKLVGVSINGRCVENYGVKGKKGFIEYYKIGVKEYDSFFMSAAKLDGIAIISRETTKDATLYLKKYAMSKASKDEIRANIQFLVGDKSEAEWTTEETVAVVKMLKEKNEISTDERMYFGTTAESMAITVNLLVRGGIEVKTLIVSGTEMATSLSNFNPFRTKSIITGVKGSVKNFESFAHNSPETLKELTILYEAFKALSEA